MNDLRTCPRYAAATVERALAEHPVVVLIGARQTGKTTLVRSLPSAGDRLFRTLDDLRALDVALRDPDLFVREGPRLTIDEVQRAPDLLRAVKRAVDDRRERGRFLLTGSANLLLMRTVSESLAGRAVYLRLGPLTESEKAGDVSPPPWSALLDAGDIEAARRAVGPRERGATARPWTEAALEGGYPPVLALSAEERARWFQGYVATYLERDLQQLASISALPDFRRLIEIAALRVGGILNRADMARDAALSRPTAHRYTNLLDVSFQARLLPPFARSRTTRLVKSPKLYWTDTGLAAHLAGIGDARDLAGDPRRGVLLENLILGHLDVWRETVVPRPEVLFWRTASGIEVDFVIEWRRRLLPVEVKAATVVRAQDAGPMGRFLDEQRAAAPFGVVAYSGDEVYAVTPRVLAVPVARLL